ncbi:hypothetical protein [Rhodococcus phage REQ1]|uniref:hypothetical protein n=1 Tax=Rhodococcus phage REQ1 TaxID=1109712 RepID=UPI00023EEBF3|nr:hypothetical protein RoPhREQ1_gp18 [Rhodococcus phage REQ1]AEV52014.1 hypothetical protein [Rhodococcus phage REQ1]
MSAETSLWLNTNTLIGMTANRGHAWHYRAEDQGERSNHYEGAIPVGDVAERLFDWEAVKVPVLAEFPADLTEATGLNADGIPVAARPVPGLAAIARSDNHHVFKVFTDGYEPHQYREWLLGAVSNILGDSLKITSAGLLRQGGQAWVEVSVPETLHDEVTGFAYRPNLLAATSLDGSLSTTYGRTITATVCDNTMAIALGQAKDAQVKIRHSRYSNLRIDEARSALKLIEETADEFTDTLHELVQTTVTDRQWFQFLDAWQPVPEEKGRAQAIATRQRDELTTMYRHDARANTWNGTAFGVIQAVNTWAHHQSTVKGATRAERNAEGAITGKFTALDNKVHTVLREVLA